jgi:hypothetical protein
MQRLIKNPVYMVQDILKNVVEKLSFISQNLKVRDRRVPVLLPLGLSTRCEHRFRRLIKR